MPSDQPRRRHLLLAACGDIGLRTVRAVAESHGEWHSTLSYTAVRRQPPATSGEANWRWLSADLAELSQRDAPDWPECVDLVIATPVPAAQGGYERGYVQVAQGLLAQLRRAGQRPGLLWVSSTSVYAGLNPGICTAPAPDCIDEETPPAPATAAGQLLLEAEDCIVNSGLPYCIVRPAGIYGPGRTGLLRRARLAPAGDADTVLSNRIHSDDVAGALAFFATKALAGESLPPLCLLTDGQPVPRSQILEWLRARMRSSGEHLQHGQAPASGRLTAGLPIDNSLLTGSGYRLRFGDWRQGYADLLAQPE